MRSEFLWLVTGGFCCGVSGFCGSSGGVGLDRLWPVGLDRSWVCLVWVNLGCGVICNGVQWCGCRVLICVGVGFGSW